MHEFEDKLPCVRTNLDLLARALALLAVLIPAAGCGSETVTPETTVGKPEKVAGLPGSIVDVDGHYLYFQCVGRGRPTVVLEAGFGGSSRNWDDVQSQLAGETRTCSYDRAGLGGSSEIAGVHDAESEVNDLERLLARAELEPPYVLVGHSYGGLLARLFTHEHPDEVAGVVLVDATHPDWRRRALELIPDTARFATLRRDLDRDVENGVNIARGLALARRVSSLGATPLVVITAGRPERSDLPWSLVQKLGRDWALQQQELAALSSESVHAVALRSNHFVQSRLTGQPAVVIRAVRAILQADRNDGLLPPCAETFRGLAVRCSPG